MSEIRIEKIDIEGVLLMMEKLDDHADSLDDNGARYHEVLADLCRAVSYLVGRSLI